MGWGRKIALAAIAAATLCGEAAAGQIDFTNAAFVPAAGQASIPVGHMEFCRSHADECSANRVVVDAEPLSDRRWADLLAINTAVNTAVAPVTDADLYQVNEYWAYPTSGYGDCEDFVLAKRRALIERGWPASTLLITVVRERNGNGHAVLTVRTDRGDLVLDNQDAMIRVWTDTPYEFLKRQSQADQGRWVDLVDRRATVVAASR
jgi:predicted transglutaminase-like cysteine proteinase